ncbi:hypothetical protein LguiB_005962 [Lonicera macranthoides]
MVSLLSMSVSVYNFSKPTRSVRSPKNSHGSVNRTMHTSTRNGGIRRLDEPTAKKRTQKKCSKCGGLGHNKKTCKGLAAIDENGRRDKPLNLFSMAF